MADLNLQLLDTEENFILISDDTETEIEYGQLAVSLVNTDYDEMYSMITDFLQSNHILRLAADLQNGKNNKLNTGKIKPELINFITKSLYKPISEYLGKEYLTLKQSAIITLLLMADIRSRLDGNKIDLGRPEHYIPIIYSDSELHQHIKDLLLKKDISYINPLQDKINCMPITSSIIITKHGHSYQSYTITDIFDYLMLDLHKYLTQKKTVNECWCCHKLFYPKYRSSEKYCYFNNSACKEKMKRSPNDKFIAKRNDFRGYQSGRIRNESTKKQYPSRFLDDIYFFWSQDCTKKYNEYKSIDDLQGFDDWFKNTKFTACRLKKEYEKWLSQQNDV